jgi:transcription elongation factor GreA
MRDRVIPLTPEGKRNLEKELDFLVNVRRPEIADKIHSAKQDGDISENAGYDAAKEEQAIVEGRINYLEALIKNSILIEATSTSDTVQLGSTVTVREAGSSSCEETYYIVGPAEADPVDGRISNESPLGKALMGCRVGQTVTIRAPDGEMKFKIVGIS